MPQFPGDISSGNAVIGAIVVILAIFVIALVLLVLYFYIHLRRLQTKYDDLVQRPYTHDDRGLSQRIQDQRKSAVLCINSCQNREPELRTSSSSDGVQPNPLSPRASHDNSRSMKGNNDIQNSRNPNSLADQHDGESWAIRKVRSMERLTELSNELTPRREPDDPFTEMLTPPSKPANTPEHLPGTVPGNTSTSKPVGELEMLPPQTGVNVAIKDVNKLSEVEPNLLTVPQINEQTSRRLSPLLGKESHGLPKWIRNPYRADHRQTYVKSNTSGYFAPGEPSSEIADIAQVPPHARPVVTEPRSPQDSWESTAPITETLHTETPESPAHTRNSNTLFDDCPHPFLERTFKLNLAFPHPYSGPTNPKASGSVKLRHYIKNARGHRRSYRNPTGAFHRRSTIGILSPHSRNISRSAKQPQNRKRTDSERDRDDLKLEAITESI
ncbi:hypothetical protein H072_5633 [Dactylellina haptotyla CBS 200.50]|uniref:Uncharacterized protein n=1 Tax=Dactylellina haptotyla (strain CBS 200.50) TaxID=1284197 RepID=S8ABY7_DACHA|nr:hypothetical protein H072_5633 [Dactylellina haptotyla CBS 200.50]